MLMTYVTTQIWVPRIGCAARKFASTDQKHCKHLGSDTLMVKKPTKMHFIAFTEQMPN